jgi:hypothetical protein
MIYNRVKPDISEARLEKIVRPLYNQIYDYEWKIKAKTYEKLNKGIDDNARRLAKEAREAK